jgi:hypothetical protein
MAYINNRLVQIAIQWEVLGYGVAVPDRTGTGIYLNYGEQNHRLYHIHIFPGGQGSGVAVVRNRNDHNTILDGIFNLKNFNPEEVAIHLWIASGYQNYRQQHMGGTKEKVVKKTVTKKDSSKKIVAKK